LNCPLFFDQLRWASCEGCDAFYDPSCKELLHDFGLFDPSDYPRFHARMKTCAHILKEAGIKVSKKKVTSRVREPGGEVRKMKKTRWTVEGPRWIS
jgi:hypothetical protein